MARPAVFSRLALAMMLVAGAARAQASDARTERSSPPTPAADASGMMEAFGSGTGPATWSASLSLAGRAGG